MFPMCTTRVLSAMTHVHRVIIFCATQHMCLTGLDIDYISIPKLHFQLQKHHVISSNRIPSHTNQANVMHETITRHQPIETLVYDVQAIANYNMHRRIISVRWRDICIDFLLSHAMYLEEFGNHNKAILCTRMHIPIW